MTIASASSSAPMVWKTMGPVLFYMVASITITLYNKWLLHDFRYPIIMLLTSSICCFVLAQIVIRLFYRHLLVSADWFPAFGWKRLFTEICPIALLFTLDTCATNASMETMSVSLVEILKTKSIVFGVLVYFCTGREEPRCSTFLITFMVTVGACLTLLGDSTATVTGVIWVEVSNVSGLFRLLLMEYVLQDKSLHPLVYLTYTMVFVVISLIPVFMILEYDDLMASEFLHPDERLRTTLILAAGGVLAFLINLSMAMTLGVVSIITLSVIGVAKLVLLVFISMYLFGYELNGYNELGIAISVVFISVYKYSRYKRMAVTTALDDDDDDDDDDEEEDKAGTTRRPDGFVHNDEEEEEEDVDSESALIPVTIVVGERYKHEQFNINGNDDHHHHHHRRRQSGHETITKKLDLPSLDFEPSPRANKTVDNHSNNNNNNNDNNIHGDDDDTMPLSTFDMEVQALLQHVDDDAADEIHFENTHNWHHKK